MTLIDSNILIDVLSDNADWYDWSRQQLDSALLQGPLVINDVIYAECSIRYETMAHFKEAYVRLGVMKVPVPEAALFAAGKAYLQYRRAGGSRNGVLPDFFIGAHATVAGLPLLTRDARRYRNYFPTIELIAPDAA